MMRVAPWFRGGHVALAAYGALFFVVLFAPIVTLLIFSFNANHASMMTWSGFTLDWYRRILDNLGLMTATGPLVGAENVNLFSDPQLAQSAVNSLVVAVLASVLATSLAMMAALGLRRAPLRLKMLALLVFAMPLVIPDIVLALASLVFFSTLGLQLSLVTIVIVHTVFLVSFALVVISARLGQLDPTLEEASHDLGEGPLRTFLRVTLPGLLPALVGAFLLCIVVSLDDVIIAFFVSGVGSTTLPVYILGAIRRGVSPEINAISILMMLISLACALCAALLARRRTHKPTP